MNTVAVVGGGIIGATIAAELILAGHPVTLFEPDRHGLPASAGNAALIALPEIAPIASPGMLAAVPGFLLDPLGPLTIRWTDMPAMLPWLLAFLGHANARHGVHARRALGSLMATALSDHETLSTRAGLNPYLRQTGYLSLHDDRASLDAALAEAGRVRAELGLDFEPVSVAGARVMVPQLEGRFFGAVHQPGYWAVTNPLAVLRAFQAFVAERGTLVDARVARIGQDGEGVSVIAGDETRRFDRVVIAAGIWSRDLVRGLGLKLLLETERGYNTTFNDLGWTLPMPLGFADHGFIATPLVDGLRVGGAVELARPATPPNFGRAKAMRAKMRRYVPALPEGGTEWMGRRPSTPDSLPVIGRHPQDERIVLAFGHGHLGLTLSAVTARLVAGLVTGRSAPGTLEPFDIARFQ